MTYAVNCVLYLLYWGILTDYVSANYYQEKTNCQARCDHHENWDNYESCLRRCTHQFEYAPDLDNHVSQQYFPKPPFNATVEFKVLVERNRKYIQAVIHWNSNKDNKRVGFWLSFTAKQINCEKQFPGYYTQDIPPSTNRWEIPLETPELRPLTVAYGCTYRVELRSKPYAYGDPAYTNLFYVTVPNCVDGICSCRKQTRVPEPKNLQAKPFIDFAPSAGNRTKALVTWQYKWRTGGGREVDTSPKVFHLKLAYLHRSEAEAPFIRLFKWLPADYTVEAQANRIDYEYVLTDRFMPDQTYKVQVFALNGHVCSSEKIEKEFYIGSDASSVLETTTRGRTPATTDTSSSSVYVPPKASTGSGGLGGKEYDRAKTTETPKSIGKGSGDSGGDGNHISTDAADRKGKQTHRHLGNISPYLEVGGLGDETHSYLLFALLTAVFIVAAMLLFCLLRAREARRKKKLEKQKYLDRFKMAPWSLEGARSVQDPSMEPNIIYTEQEIAEGRARGYLDHFEIPNERLKFGRVIGQGAFGMVYLGTAQAINGILGTTTVAIKQLKANADEAEREEFLAEIHIMKQVGNHPNLVAMYACCTMQFPQCMVMEYVPYGDLKHYLQNLRKEYEKAVEEYRESVRHDYVMNLRKSPGEERAHNQNLAMSARRKQQQRKKLGSSSSFMDDPQAMTSSVKSSASFTIGEIPFADEDTDYPDLTYSLDPAELQSFAQQVAGGMAHVEMLGITHRDLAARNILVGHGKLLKISDFGMSRLGTYVKHTRGVIPLRWLSIEAIRDNLYTTNSDVWAYGVLLWEICTLGGFPYPTVQDKDLLRYLESGGRLEKPSSCSDEFYDLMLECWTYTATKRPSFGRLVDRLTEMDRSDSPYVEFAAPSVTLPPPDDDAVSGAPSQMLTSFHSGIVPSEII